MCVQRLDDSEFCNSHYVSHFAAFFIVTGAKTSLAEGCFLVFSFGRGALVALPCGWADDRAAGATVCLGAKRDGGVAASVVLQAFEGLPAPGGPAVSRARQRQSRRL